jgi:acyl-coenzyme A thioesterase PaaI-like protein
VESAFTDDDPHLVTGLDVRYLSSPRVGPARATAQVLRGDPTDAHCWVEVVDAGDDDRAVVHAFATTRARQGLGAERST